MPCSRRFLRGWVFPMMRGDNRSHVFSDRSHDSLDQRRQPLTDACPHRLGFGLGRRQDGGSLGRTLPSNLCDHLGTIGHDPPTTGGQRRPCPVLPLESA
jgi:hypothetical protein